MLSKIIFLLKKWHKAKYDKIFYQRKNMPVHQYLKINPMPELSGEDIRIIDEYWAQYGIKYRDYSWFQWFSGIFRGGKTIHPL